MSNNRSDGASWLAQLEAQRASVDIHRQTTFASLLWIIY